MSHIHSTSELADPFCLSWVGREQYQSQVVDAQCVMAMAATLGRERPADGSALPPGWQWLFFNPVASRDDLGYDGHPKRNPDSFLPPVVLPRRMWAGSRIRYVNSINVGVESERVSRIASITPKEGRSGLMCFVTVNHTYFASGQVCIEEAQDIVYRDAGIAAPDRPRGSAAAAPAPVQFKELVTADSPLLFRYSALTFNGHRIHYDRPYACDIEGYRSLVVHGPLMATLLQDFACRCKPDNVLAGFDFKSVSPIFVDETFELQAWDAGLSHRMNLRVLDAHGALAMLATAHTEPR